MAHVRQQIRSNIISTLTGLTTTGSRVYQTRVYPIAANKLPGLAIYTDTEEIETVTISPPRTQMRALTVTVEAYVKATTGYDNTLDTIAKEVEEALAADLTRNGLAKDTLVTGFEADFAGDGDQPVATGRISVRVEYATLENDVETAA